MLTLYYILLITSKFLKLQNERMTFIEQVVTQRGQDENQDQHIYDQVHNWNLISDDNTLIHYQSSHHDIYDKTH